MAKSLTRSTTDKYIAGVCGGLGAAFNVDSNIIRVVLVLVTLFTSPAGWLIYPALWLLLPTDAGGPSGFDQLKSSWAKGAQRR